MFHYQAINGVWLQRATSLKHLNSCTSFTVFSMTKNIPMHKFRLPVSQLTHAQWFMEKFLFFSAHWLSFELQVTPGPRGMRREYIRATPAWRKGHARYDCVFVNAWPELPGMCGLEVARIFLFFSFVHQGTRYPCALVQWFPVISDKPEDETGFWMVEPAVHEDGQPFLAVIHLESIFRAAHLSPAYHSSDFVRRSLTMHDTLDKFKIFYVNRFVDHHAFDIVS